MMVLKNQNYYQYTTTILAMVGIEILLIVLRLPTSV